MAPPHSDLPIIHLDPPQRSQKEKYGSLFYVGITGLVVLVLLVGWFAFGVWSMSDVFANVYRLHDPARTDAERIHAAYALSKDPRVTQRQYWDISLRKELPGLARYLMAESLTQEAMASDPKGYAEAVAYSEGWPDWLRLLLLRPLAYGAGDGIASPPKPLLALSTRDDPFLVLWVLYTRSVSGNDGEAERALAQAAADPGPRRELADLLLAALRSQGPERRRHLDQATRWLRAHHPQAADLWKGWDDRGDRLVPGPAPELP
jgi:hypothetical protein